MGGAVSRKFKELKEEFLNTEVEIEAVQFLVDETVSGQTSTTKKMFERMGLSNGSVNSLYGAFRAIDVDGGGLISDQEFYTFFRLDQSKFTDRAFFLFDKDGTGELDFEEFVAAVWNFCTIEGEDLVRFAFNLYDLDGGGTLDETEIAELVKSVLGAKVDVESTKGQALLRNLTLDDKGEANVRAFKEFVALVPEVLEPVFVLQRRLRHRICGEAFWKSLSRKRRAMIKGELDAKSEKLKGMVYEDKDDGGKTKKLAGKFMLQSEEVQRQAQKAAEEIENSWKGTEVDRALRRIAKVKKVREKLDVTQAQWKKEASGDGTPLDMILTMEDPGASSKTQSGIMKNIGNELEDALHTAEDPEFRDFGVRKTKSGCDRRGRRRRRMSSAVRFKGERPEILRKGL